MGAVDNRFGAAGPAGPVAELIAVETRQDLDYGLSQVLAVAAATRPYVLNMSGHSNVKVFKGSTAKIVDAVFKQVRP